jgi:MraZ protein
MFLGRYAHSVDTKGRLAVPSRFRDGLADGLVVTRGIDRCLMVYPLAVWRPFAERVAALPVTDADARLFRRMVFADAVDLEIDSQGRVLVPAELREWAHLEREALVIGVYSSIEVWSPERWREVDETIGRDGAAVAQRLGPVV